MKGDSPNETDIEKATMLSWGCECPVLIAVGAPWSDSPYCYVTGDFYEDRYGPFRDRPGAIDAYVSARSARFEFGETPLPLRLTVG